MILINAPQLFDILLQAEAVNQSIFATRPLAYKLRIKALSGIVLMWLPKREPKWRYQKGMRSLLGGAGENQIAGVTTGGGATLVTGGGGATLVTGGGAENVEGNTNSGNGDSNGGTSADSAKSTDAANGNSKTDNANNNDDESDDEDDDLPEKTETAVEELVELLLESLVHVNTMVRWTAAKGFGRITGRLSRDYADQIVDAILECCFVTKNDKGWHGGCLALAELARRGRRKFIL
jgi:hypothetical protein